MMDQSEWHLGQTSERYETRGRGANTISTGKGDRGGVSYGAYQLSTKMGTLREYLNQSSYKDKFKGLEPATPGFNSKWRELAKTDPEFAQDQHDFIKRTHYDVQDGKLKAKGIDLSNCGPAVQDALWSTSVQFRNLAPGIFANGLREKFGKDFKLAALSDKDIVEAVQDYKISHNNELFSKSPTLWPGLLERARNEKSDLVQLATREEALNKNSHQREPGSPSLSNPAHCDYPLFKAIRDKLLTDAPDNVAARVMMQAKANGITRTGQLQSVTVADGHAFVMGTIPGFRAKVDLSAPEPTMEQINEQLAMQREVHLQQQTQAKLQQSNVGDR